MVSTGEFGTKHQSRSSGFETKLLSSDQVLFVHNRSFWGNDHYNGSGWDNNETWSGNPGRNPGGYPGDGMGVSVTAIPDNETEILRQRVEFCKFDYTLGA